MSVRRCSASGKVTFPTPQDAVTALRAIRIRGRKRGRRSHGIARNPIEHYKCDQCGGWHLTSKRPAKGKRDADVHGR